MNLKSVLAGLALAAASLTQAAPALTDIVGRYDLTTNPAYKVIIDAQGRVKTNLKFEYNNGLSQASVVFPHFLKQDDFTDAWSTQGTVAMQYVSNLGQVFQCNMPVKFDAEWSGDFKAMDVTLTHAQTVQMDSLGRCVAIGSTQEFLSFNRE